jgi:DNA-binding NtrC family response regulator
VTAACPEAIPNLIGRAPLFSAALDAIRRMACFDAPALVQGETGTGKELAARAIHYLSARRNAPFVALNCGAVPENLIESELFGCERGAYTGASRARPGLASAAQCGTLFLDEIDALPARAQVSLLRFLQEHAFRPVGGTRETACDVRIIAAASPRLSGLISSGAFRDDLAYRLNVLTLEMPPLRARPGDPQLLAEHFAAREARHHGLARRPLDDASLQWMDQYAWPGNVRELHNLVQRALCMSDGAQLHIVPAAPVSTAIAPVDADLPDSHTLPFDDARTQALRRFEWAYLQALMTTATGNVTQAARLAGKERRTLGRLLKRHGIDRHRFERRTSGNS